MGRKKKSEPKRVREEALASVHEREKKWKKEKEREQGKNQMKKLEQGEEI